MGLTAELNLNFCGIVALAQSSKVPSPEGGQKTNSNEQKKQNHGNFDADAVILIPDTPIFGRFMLQTDQLFSGNKRQNSTNKRVV